MLKLKPDFYCILRDKKTMRELCTFGALASGDGIYSADFEGGGIASASQSRTIYTEYKFDYKPLQHEIIIDGRIYLLTSYMPSMRRKLGAGICGKPRVVYVLNLE